MKKKIFILSVLLLQALESRSQIHLPDFKSSSPGLLNSKKINVQPAENNLKATSDLKWHSLPSPTNGGVPEASIACDGNDLIIYYREPLAAINTNEGTIKYWNSNSWGQTAIVTHECHAPDIDTKGSVFAATAYDDGWDYIYSSNINGSIMTFKGILLMHQYNPRAAMAMGFPYMSFVCRYSEGMPVSYNMLHILSPLGSGKKVELTGGWRIVGTDVGLDTDIAGDDNAWYCVYIQQNYLFVDKGSVVNGQSQYSELGNGFRMYNAVSSPEIAIYKGNPVVAWFESNDTEFYIAEWNGSEWLLLGTGEFETGTLNSLRMASSSTDLYVACTALSGDTNLLIARWNGATWNQLPSVQSQTNSRIGTADIALFNNEPVVAFTENDQLKIKIYSSTYGLDKYGQNAANPVINCFPNPVQKNFTIELDRMYEDVSYELKNVAGKTMERKILARAKVIHGTIETASGPYFMEIFTKKEKLGTLKIIKK